MKRHFTKRVFERSPLVAVLGQVKFAAVLSMETFVPDIQERLRRNGFPRFKKIRVQEVTWSPSGIQEEVVDRWEFADIDKSWMIVLTANSVTVQTSAYKTFEDPMRDRLNIALDSLRTAAQPEFAERIGLRYVNLVGRAEGERFRAYLHPGLLGPLAEEMGVHDLQTSFVCRGTTEEGSLLVRCVFVKDGSTLPPDLQGIDLVVKPNLPNPADPVRALLDIDHFSFGVQSMETRQLIETFERLHLVTERTFDAAITPHAKSAWGLREEGYGR